MITRRKLVFIAHAAGIGGAALQLLAVVIACVTAGAAMAERTDVNGSCREVTTPVLFHSWKCRGKV